MPWYVIYTKSRSEKLVAEGLRKKGLEVYCPLRKVKRKWSDRFKIVEEPLFRSYCFVELDSKDLSLAFGVPGFVRYLYWLKKPAIVKPKEIELIKRMMNDFDHEAIEVLEFNISDTVRIDSGAFMDQEGEIAFKQGKKITLWLESLGVFISVDSSKTKVEKAQKEHI